MSDRPSAINGKRNRAWGTMDACPACGQCLCFGCHPAGPCVDEDAAAASNTSAGTAGTSAAGSASSVSAGWYAPAPTSASGASGLRMCAGPDTTGERLR
jgi:hypothetical protein